MKITRVEATPLVADFADVYGGIDKVPPWILRPAAHFQAIPRTGQYSTLVEVEAEDGTVGYGEAWGLPMPELAASVVNRLIGPMVVDQKITDAGRIWEDISLYFQRLGYTRGVTVEALAGVDIALWDLRGKLENKPIHALIGGLCRDRVDCYASPVMFKDTLEETGTAAREFRAAGFTGIKIKVGRGVETDVSHIAAARDALGPDITLKVDVNCGYDSVTASTLAREIEAFDIDWLEEPVPPCQPEEMRRVKDSTSIRIASGENDFSVEDFSALLSRSHIDVVMPNVSRAGGITGALRIAELADARGAEFSLHGVGSGIMRCASMHLLGVIPNARCFEVNTFPNPLRDQLAAPLPPCTEGVMAIPTAPGLGCEIDLAVARRFRSRHAPTD
jgi:D-galactarolactone cycloisomerase